jgi:poly(A) polymerase
LAEQPGVTPFWTRLRAAARAWFVGGCVRDGLLGLEAGDIDIATDATPDRVTELAEDAGLRAVPTGAEHGTITIVADHFPVEVTTLRRDVATDGRRATVAFTDRMEEDAHRRDFTVNALYATPDGEVLDPVEQGLDDLRARRIRFIGYAHDRIREDYLRILRFFRFHAWYADPGQGMDADGLAASAELADGIDRLAKERIGRRCASSWPRPIRPLPWRRWRAGVLHRVLPGAEDRFCRCWWRLEGDAPPDPMRRLAILGGRTWTTRCACRGPRRRRWPGCAMGLGGTRGSGRAGLRHGARLARDILLLRARCRTTGRRRRRRGAGGRGRKPRSR